MGRCSTCGSPDATKVTCPCNPQARNPRADKHPLCVVPTGDTFELGLSNENKVIIDAYVGKTKFDVPPDAQKLLDLPTDQLLFLMTSIDDLQTLINVCRTNKATRKMCNTNVIAERIKELVTAAVDTRRIRNIAFKDGTDARKGHIIRFNPQTVTVQPLGGDDKRQILMGRKYIVGYNTPKGPRQPAFAYMSQQLASRAM